MSGQFHLMTTSRFLPFFVTQFMGAFNDNVFKSALVVLLTFHTSEWTSLPPALLASIAGGLFILPFFLFSATSGQIADKYCRDRIARFVKILEIGILIIVGIGFYFHSLNLLFFCLFLFGVHSTLFGPVKYAILPQHLSKDELIAGNALIESGTFVAILLGTILGGVLADISGNVSWLQSLGVELNQFLITFIGIVIAFIGYGASRYIPKAEAPDHALVFNLNPITATFQNLKMARSNRSVFLAILALSWFWLYGLLFLSQFPVYAKDILHGTPSVFSMLLITFTIGIGIGSLWCDRLSKHTINVALVPIGALGLTIFGFDFSWSSANILIQSALMTPIELLQNPMAIRILADIALLGVCGGLYCVPLYALVQDRSSEQHRARIIASNNIVNALFMVVGSVVSGKMLSSGATLPQLFCWAAVCNTAVAIYIFSVIPEYYIRLKQFLHLTP